MLTRAFTCTGPYAILVLLGIKRVENRSMWLMPSALAVQVTAADSLAQCVGVKVATRVDAERPFGGGEKLPCVVQFVVCAPGGLD